MIELDHLSVTLGTFRLHDLSLQVECGEYLVLMGPSGAGKTLLLETIAGLHHPESGVIRISGTDVGTIPPEQREIGFVYQDYSLFPHYRVAENVSFGLRMAGVDREECRVRVKDLLRRFGISHLAGRYPGTLSGGEQQRVAIARAVAVNPKVLLLDEPFAALDSLNREQCMRDLKSFHLESNLTILQVSHSREEAYRLADRIAVMDRGIIIQAGVPGQVFGKPSHPVVAGLAGFENVFHGTVRSNEQGILSVITSGLTIHARGNYPPGTSVLLCMNADDLNVRPLGRPGEGEGRWMEGIVESVIPMGKEFRIFINIGIPVIASVSRKEWGEGDFTTGRSVGVTYDERDIHLIQDTPPNRIAEVSP